MATRTPRRRADPRPVGNAHFLVDLGFGDPESPEAGFAEVFLPPLGGTGDDAATPPRLVLRRGVTGALDLYDWWERSRRTRRARPRDVTVTLLGPGRAPVMRWCFRNARPVQLSYAPLLAHDGAVLMETIEIAFDAMQVTR